MSGTLVFTVAGAMLFSLGLAGIVLIVAPLRRVLAYNVMGSGSFLVLVSFAQRAGAADPVPQAMVLTGIVVSVAATALALALIRRLHPRAARDAVHTNDWRGGA